MQDFHLMAHICHRLTYAIVCLFKTVQVRKMNIGQNSGHLFQRSNMDVGVGCQLSQLGVSTLLPIVLQKKLHIRTSHIGSRIKMRADPCARI